MKHRLFSTVVCICAFASLAGCGSGGGESSAQSSPTSASTDAMESSPTPFMQSNAKLPIVITFDEVAVAAGAGALRINMELKNQSKDPVQCDPSEFSAILGSASPIDADTSAADSCDPDSVDPGTTGKATIFFNVPGDYKGPLTVNLTVDGEVVGSGATQIH